MDTNVRQRSKHQTRGPDQTNDRKKSKRINVITNDKTIISRFKDIMKRIFKFFGLILIIVSIVLILSPIVFRYSLTVRRLFIFMNYFNFPLFKNLSDPKNSFGMNCTRNLYIPHEDNNQLIRLGVWHILPSSRSIDCVKQSNSLDESVGFDDDRPIFLYLHGNGGARGGHHRRQLYDVLSQSDQLDGHVIAFDYRGYGDSTNLWPTAEGLKNDANAVYYWLLKENKINRSRVIVWGHSLGTGVGVRLISELPKDDIPRALILEAPFTSMSEAFIWHPLSQLFRHYFPYFNEYFVEPVVNSSVTNFDSISLLNRIEIPLLILHSQDDGIVPFHLGHKLYEQSLEKQPKSCRKAQMIAFNGHFGYGHKYIFRAKELPIIIDKFIKIDD